MDSNYDEDLNENSFFQLLQSDHKELFLTATHEGWIICVPRSGSLPKYSMSAEDFFSHILIPSDELPESHFRTLNDKDVRICNRLITVEHNDISRPYSTHILFEETYYTEDMLRYKVLCVENPLERRVDHTSAQVGSTGILTVRTLRDCIDLLWTESNSKEVLEHMDQYIRNFISSNESIELESIQVQKDKVGSLYTQCLQIALKDVRLREKASVSKHFMDTVKLSVETYTHHGIYRRLMKGITACTAYEDSSLNKTVRNLSDMQLRDLCVRPDLYDTISQARQVLARIDCYSTVLGKISCLKRMVSTISKQTSNPSTEIGNAIAADDLLPVIIFLIIKTGIPNWIAHLTYMKEFRFSASSSFDFDEACFLITTLEAAIEHVKSGILLGPSAPESQLVYENSENGSDILDLKSPPTTSSSSLAQLFEHIRLGNDDIVGEILDKNLRNTPMCPEEVLPQLCHPLCSCDKCESLRSHSLCATTPTIHSCDDRGFTALHIACMFGQPKVVDMLIPRGVVLDASDYSGSTPLHYAASRGHQNALLLLVHAGAKVNVFDNDGNSPLHFASNNGHEGCVKALLYFNDHCGAQLDLNVANVNGDTPLHHASRWGYEGIVQILTEYGARPNILNRHMKSPIDYAHNLHISRILNSVASNDSDKVRCPERRLSTSSNATSNSKASMDFDEVTRPISPNSYNKGKEERGVRPQSTEQIKNVERLLRAITFGDTQLAGFYLGVDSPPNNGTDVRSLCHPLCTCEKCLRGESEDEGTPTLPDLDREALNINVCDSDGFTPLHVAAKHGRTDIVQLILDEGAKVNVMTRSQGSTPLQMACQNERIQAAQLLLQSGDCDVNLQDSVGNTALHYACFSGNSRLVEILLKHGPALDKVNVEGKTPAQVAEEKMSLTVLRLLRGGKSLSLTLL